MLFIRENITFKSLPDIPVPVNIECLFVSLIIRKKKWFIGYSDNPSKNIIILVKCLNYYSRFHVNILLLGDIILKLEKPV